MVPLGFREVIFTCNAIGKGFSPSVEWFRDSPTEHTISFSRSLSTHNSEFTSAELKLENGFGSSDAGKYYCVVEARVADPSHSESITLSVANQIPLINVTQGICIVTSTTVRFQIRVFGTECPTWGKELKDQIGEEFSEVILGGIASLCSDCLTVNEDSTLVTMPPICSGIIEGAAVFKGQISGQRIGKTEAHFCALNAWKRLGPSVLVNGNIRPVDRNCILSDNGNECTLNIAASTAGVSAGSSVTVLFLLVVSVPAVVASVLIIRRYDIGNNYDACTDSNIFVESLSPFRG